MAGALRGEIPDLEPMKKLVRDDLRHILESVCVHHTLDMHMQQFKFIL